MARVTNTNAIRTIAEYRQALKTIESLMTAAPETPAGEEFDALVALVENYESKHYGVIIEHA